MVAFTDNVYTYRKVDEHSRSICIWSFVVMILAHCILWGVTRSKLP